MPSFAGMKALVAVLQRPRPKVGRLRGACHQGIPPYFAILRHPLPSASRLQVQAPAVGGSSCEPERLHGPGPIAGQAVQKGGLSRLACSTRVAHVQPVMMCRYARPNRPRPGLSPGRPPQPPRRPLLPRTSTLSFSVWVSSCSPAISAFVRRRRRIEARSDSEVEAKRARFRARKPSKTILHSSCCAAELKEWARAAWPKCRAPACKPCKPQEGREETSYTPCSACCAACSSCPRTLGAGMLGRRPLGCLIQVTQGPCARRPDPL